MSKTGRWNPDTGKVEWQDTPKKFVCSDLPACPNTYGEGKPLKSRGMAVHPTQSKEFNEGAKSAGIKGVYYDDKGYVHFTSRKARALEGRRRGMQDNDAGYGDYGGR